MQTNPGHPQGPAHPGPVWGDSFSEKSASWSRLQHRAGVSSSPWVGRSAGGHSRNGLSVPTPGYGGGARARGAATWPEAPPTPSGMCRWWEGSDPSPTPREARGAGQGWRHWEGSLRGGTSLASLAALAAPTGDQWSQITFRRARARTGIMAGLNKQMGRWGRGGSLANPPRTAPPAAAISLRKLQAPQTSKGPCTGGAGTWSGCSSQTPRIRAKCFSETVPLRPENAFSCNG